MEQLERWAGFKRVAIVMLGEPPLAFKKYGQETFVRQSRASCIALEFFQLLSSACIGSFPGGDAAGRA